MGPSRATRVIAPRPKPSRRTPTPATQPPSMPSMRTMTHSHLRYLFMRQRATPRRRCTRATSLVAASYHRPFTLHRWPLPLQRRPSPRRCLRLQRRPSPRRCLPHRWRHLPAMSLRTMHSRLHGTCWCSVGSMPPRPRRRPTPSRSSLGRRHLVAASILARPIHFAAPLRPWRHKPRSRQRRPSMRPRRRYNHCCPPASTRRLKYLSGTVACR